MGNYLLKTLFVRCDPEIIVAADKNHLCLLFCRFGQVKNPRPEDVALFGAPCKGAERVPSDPGVVGVVE